MQLLNVSSSVLLYTAVPDAARCTTGSTTGCMHTAGWMNYANKYVYSPKQAENNQQIDRQNRWTDSIDRQNDKPINYNTTKHLIKTENPQPHMQTFDKIKLNKMVMHVHTKTYYTVSQKKQDTKLLPITSPNVNRFSKFFHWQTHC